MFSILSQAQKHIACQLISYILHNKKKHILLVRLVKLSKLLHLFDQKYSKSCNIVKYYYNLK